MSLFPHLRAPDHTGCAGFQPTPQLTRRAWLQAGSLGLLQLGLTDLLATGKSGATVPGFGKAKACILLFMWGGPSQLDTWDPKPGAPSEIRGEFKTIATTTPGLHISEHFPLLAQQAHRYAVVRSMTHDDPAHLSSVHHVLTGRLAPRVNSDADPPSRRDWPHIGSVLAKFQPSSSALPPFVTMPWIVSHPAAPGGVAPGQNAGWMGASRDPFVLTSNPNNPGFSVGGSDSSADETFAELHRRESLLKQMDTQACGVTDLSRLQEKAIALLTSPSAQRAFDIGQEPPRVRDRYGRHIHGQCLLLARRLIESGVRLVTVNWHQDNHNFWDTHGDNFNSLKRRLMPPADRGFSALIEDLAERGLLDETLLVWVGEFGRRPQITVKNAGREHWPGCYSAVLAGGGIRGGSIYGHSDNRAAYPEENPVRPSDLTATMYHALGVAPDQFIRDREGRPARLTEGNAVMNLFA
jgi:hypothetical protein